jgi:hypothetical protein
MKTLQAYIDQKNKWNAIFKGEQFETKTAKGRQRIANSLDADLSPENLTCDGEVRGEALRQKSAYLFRCVEELINLDPNVKFSELSI